MPQANPPPPWERGEGHDGRPERPETYARFRAWLELGPSRNLATYAAVLGVSKQSLSETAARFNWRQRAAAWDSAEAAAGRQHWGDAVGLEVALAEVAAVLGRRADAPPAP